MTVIMAILLQAVPIIWNEPADPGRAVSRDNAIGLCAITDQQAVAEMDAMLRGGKPGNCQSLDGLWRVSRRIADRCIGEMPGWYIDENGRKNPSMSCYVEAHTVEIRQGDTVRLAMIALHADQME